jgi:hypothetical protein
MRDDTAASSPATASRPLTARRSSSPSSSGTASPPTNASPRSVLGGEAADRLREVADEEKGAWAGGVGENGAGGCCACVALSLHRFPALNPPLPLCLPSRPPPVAASAKPPLVHIHAHNDSAAVTQAPDGVRLEAADLARPRPNTPAEDALATVTMLLFFGLAQALPLAAAACVVAALVWRSVACATVLAALAALAFLPAGGRRAAILHSPVWDAWRRRFRYCGVVPAVPYCDPATRYVFAHFPHAVYPMGSFLSFPLCGDPATGVPAPMEGLVASVLLRVPLFKHIFGGLGCHSADKATMMDLLRTSSVGVIVEGIAGVFHGACPGAERVYLSRRKGFVKAAIQAGAPLVPVYHLGASQLLSFSGNGGLSRRWRLTVACYWGAAGLPLPRSHDIISLVGKPIPVAQEDSPDQATIDAVHARFTAALVGLFDQYKHLLGPEWAAKELEVV